MSTPANDGLLHETRRTPEKDDLGAMVQPRLRFLRQRLWFRLWWRQFNAEVFGKDASVGPLGGWLLLALFGLVAYLTLTFSEGAIERGQVAHGADPSGVISVEAGYWTLFLVALVALVIGFEQQLRSRWELSIVSGGRRWFARRPGLRLAVHLLWRLPSVIMSLFDYVLTRMIAPLTGATQKNALRRYAWAAAVILLLPCAGMFARPPFGLYAVLGGIVAVLAIVRRWNWTEADRERLHFEMLAWRGQRQEGQRRGFNEDLRGEALVALVCLFLLVPLCLQQFQAASCQIGACAFILGGRDALASDAFGQFLAWLGFFGAELAKAVPFVDWSEVFHVANESPIKPRTPLGAQVVFAMRVGLDLLLLGAIVQAMQIAGRQRLQHAAFRAGLLPVLDPITEARELRNAGNGIEDALGLAPSEQPSIASFPPYDQARLREIAYDTNFDPAMRKAAAGVLARQHPFNPNELANLAKTDPDPAMRSWLLGVAGRLAPDIEAGVRAAERRRLKVVLADREQSVAIRAAAARVLGRMGQDDATVNLLLEQLSDRRGTDPSIRAAAAVGLAKQGIASAKDATLELAGSFIGAFQDPIAAMATAYACARLSAHENAERIAELFIADLREYALRAARIQPEPLSITTAREREPGIYLDQLVSITPGQGPFPPTFRMGSLQDDKEADNNEKPPCEITMARHFALGRYVVTEEEYLAFCETTGRTAIEPVGTGLPQANVFWEDAIAYCAWLEQITGERYRLPTEAEWEYACRAGTTTRYSFGDDEKDLGEHAWYIVNKTDEALARARLGSISNGPHPVGKKKPNAWGLYDMHGNVWEWCADPWHANYTDRPNNASAWLQDGDFRYRVLRGGSWEDGARSLRSAHRHWHTARGGFRVATTLTP